MYWFVGNCHWKIKKKAFSTFVSYTDKVVAGLKFVWELWLSLIDSITLKLNEQNLNYRNVTLQLSSEKDRLSRKFTREELV